MSEIDEAERGGANHRRVATSGDVSGRARDFLAGAPYQRWRQAPWMYAIAALVLIGLLAGLGAWALAGRGSQDHFAATIVPAPAATTSSADSGATSSSSQGFAAAGPAQAARSSQAPGSSQGFASLPSPIVPFNSCPGSPTVQLQNKGLVVTGSAAVMSASGSAATLSVSVQRQGSDVNTLLGDVQAKLDAVIAALKGVGVPESNIQQTYLSSYGSGTQFTAYASLQARLTGQDQLAPATKAVTQVQGVTSYSTSTSLSDQATSQEMQTAVASAASQARDMATSTARAMGIGLGSVEGVVTQPPALCYLSGGPTRVVQVTVTYALK